jgi:diketogulonate reductase-like aldo/keto reductase
MTICSFGLLPNKRKLSHVRRDEFRSLTEMTMTRRNFSLACAASLAAAKTGLAQQPASASPIIQFSDGGTAPALGMGTWRLAEGRRPVSEEEAALKAGFDQGIGLIDTAEMYGDGSAEEMVGRVTAGIRDRIFIVSKVLPYNATSEAGIRQACTRSLNRMKTDYIDLYLLHWRGSVRDLGLVVRTFSALKQEGKIRRWGVSSFDVSDMEELLSVEGGNACDTNQVRYNLEDRGIEQELMPWSARHKMPLMAYSPIGAGNGLLRNPALASIAKRHNSNPAAVAIAWTMRDHAMISIPGSGSAAHIREDAEAARITLTQQDLHELDGAFPA